MSEVGEMNVEGAIKALQTLCVDGEKYKPAVEFCPCEDGLIEKVRISSSQVGKAMEIPPGVLKAFASED